jgi:hypothetical protein
MAEDLGPDHQPVHTSSLDLISTAACAGASGTATTSRCPRTGAVAGRTGEAKTLRSRPVAVMLAYLGAVREPREFPAR